MNKIIKYVLYDILRSRTIIGYTAFLFIMSMGLFNLENDPTKAVLSLLNVVLLIVPLISIIFATIHFYNSIEFVELLVSQPINRHKIFMSEYLGTALSLAMAFVIGVGVPAMLFNPGPTSIYLVTSGVFLSFIFTSLAFLASVLTRDKAKGIGIALMLWFYFSLLYDGIVMFILFYFADYPLDNVTLALLSLNPIDLGRVLVLLNIDVSALMGYTGALYKSFFGNWTGIALAFGLMVIWVIVPLFFAQRKFVKKDL
jgi:Cu-processing system permease protein